MTIEVLCNEAAEGLRLISVNKRRLEEGLSLLDEAHPVTRDELIVSLVELLFATSEAIEHLRYHVIPALLAEEHAAGDALRLSLDEVVVSYDLLRCDFEHSVSAGEGVTLSHVVVTSLPRRQICTLPS